MWYLDYFFVGRCTSTEENIPAPGMQCFEYPVLCGWPTVGSLENIHDFLTTMIMYTI